MLVPWILATLPIACLTSEAKPAPSTAEYTAHEWGTFTTVADDQGDPLRWRPLLTRSDLPPFVYEVRSQGKGATVALVRMETPVIYFYADAPLTVSVEVGFPKGVFTEWYPQAAFDMNTRSSIRWPIVHIGADGAPPESKVQSHYLPAREVDSELVGVGDEREQFLFYRGVADFQPTLKFRLDGDRVEPVGAPHRPFIVFERDAEHTAFAVVKDGRGVSLPVAGAGDVRQALHAMLVQAGLYDDEAAAMIRSWEGDWFEPGLRVFWLYTPAEVEAVLPLTLNPAPASLTRVLVGRTELISADMREQARALAVQHTEPGPLYQAMLDQFGRFAGPTARLAAQDGGPGSDRLLFVAGITGDSAGVVD